MSPNPLHLDDTYIYVQIHQHYSLQRCSTSFSAARPVFCRNAGIWQNQRTTSITAVTYSFSVPAKTAQLNFKQPHGLLNMHKRSWPTGPLFKTRPALHPSSSPIKSLICHEWPTRTVLPRQGILDPSIHFPVLDTQHQSSPCTTGDLICYEWFKELLYQVNGCVPITHDTFQNLRDLPYPHKKYWTHRSTIQY